MKKKKYRVKTKGEHHYVQVLSYFGWMTIKSFKREIIHPYTYKQDIIDDLFLKKQDINSLEQLSVRINKIQSEVKTQNISDNKKEEVDELRSRLIRICVFKKSNPFYPRKMNLPGIGISDFQELYDFGMHEALELLSLLDPDAEKKSPALMRDAVVSWMKNNCITQSPPLPPKNK